MSMKAALTFTRINLKKLAKIKGGNPSLSGYLWHFLQLLTTFWEFNTKWLQQLLAETILSTI